MTRSFPKFLNFRRSFLPRVVLKLTVLLLKIRLKSRKRLLLVVLLLNRLILINKLLTLFRLALMMLVVRSVRGKPRFRLFGQSKLVIILFRPRKKSVRVRRAVWRSRNGQTKRRKNLLW